MTDEKQPGEVSMTKPWVEKWFPIPGSIEDIPPNPGHMCCTGLPYVTVGDAFAHNGVIPEGCRFQCPPALSAGEAVEQFYKAFAAYHDSQFELHRFLARQGHLWLDWRCYPVIRKIGEATPMKRFRCSARLLIDVSPDAALERALIERDSLDDIASHFRADHALIRQQIGVLKEMPGDQGASTIETLKWALDPKRMPPWEEAD